MTRVSKHFAIPLAAVAAVFLGSAPKADAGFQVTLKVDASLNTITDGGAGDLDAILYGSDVANQITISQTFGGYNFNLTLSTTNTPGGAIAFVNTGVNQIQDVGALNPNATVSIIASASGFLSPTAAAVVATSGATAQFLAGTPAGNSATASFDAYVDTTNALWNGTGSGGTLVGTGSAVIPAVGNASLDDSQVFALLASPYTMNLVLTSAFVQGGSTIDLDGTFSLVTAVPEPTTMAAAIAGLPLLGGFWLRRKMRRSA